MPLNLNLQELLERLSDETTREEELQDLLEQEHDYMRDENGVTCQVIRLQDATLPVYLLRWMRDNKLCFHSVNNFPVRDDDVFLFDFGKTGTHWLCNMIHFMRQEGDLTDAKSYQPAGLEIFSEDMLDKLPSPRLLASHLLPDSVPHQIFTKHSKLILLYRNPKDIAVSLYHHLRKTPGSDYQVSWNCHVTNFMKGQSPMVDFFHYHNTWDQALKDKKDFDALVISYEQLKKTPIEALRKVSKYLGLDLSDKRLMEITEKCSLQNLKKDVESGSVKTPLVDTSGKSVLYRKGIIGDWRTHFTVTQNEVMDAVIAAKVPKDTMFKFEYS